MNKFFEFNLNVELGEIFNECNAYQISIEYLNKAFDIGIDIIAVKLSWINNKCYFNNKIKIDLKKW